MLQPDYLGPENTLYFVVLSISGFAIFIVSLGGLITLLLINTRLIKLTSPVFTFLILGGCLMLAVSCFFLLGENTSVNCAIRPWLFNLAFTCAFSPLLIKAWKIHVMFNVQTPTKQKVFSAMTLCIHTIQFVIVDVLILSFSLYLGGSGTTPETVVSLSTNGAYADTTICAYVSNTILLYAEVCFKGSLILLACVLAFKIRNISGTVAASKTLLAIVYNVAFISAVILIICRSVSDVSTIIVSQTAGICFCVVFSAALLVIPTCWHLATVGDDEAADEVMQEVMNNVKKQTKTVCQTYH